MDEVIIVMVTAPSDEVCRQIANHLLENKMIACANILPAVRSLYTWKGETQDEEEVLMLCKSRVGLFEELSKAVRKLHPYELPEIIALPVTHGLPAYLDWVLKETGF